MLTILRKHQKSIFMVVACTTILSFSFFGTYSAMLNKNNSVVVKEEDHTIVSRMDGSTLSFLTTEKLAHFIAGDETGISEGMLPVNPFLDRFLERDLIESGVLEQLAVSFKEEVLPDFLELQAKSQNIPLYKHSKYGFFSVEGAWSRYAEGMAKNYAEWKKGGSLESQIAVLANLYLGQAQFPPHALRQLLKMEQERFLGAADPLIHQTSLALFGAHSAKEFFGPKLLLLASQYIQHINALSSFEKIDEKASYALALSHLKTFYERGRKEGDEEVPNLEALYRQAVMQLGINEKDLLSMVATVELFRRTVHEKNANIALHPMPFEEICDHLHAKLVGNHYKLSEAILPRHFFDLAKLECYIQKVTEGQSKTELPTALIATEGALAKNPDVVKKRYVVELCHVKKKDVASMVSMKELLSWCCEHADLLQAKLGVDLVPLFDSGEKTLFWLESLEAKRRMEIEKCALEMIFEKSPSMLEALFSRTPSEKREIDIFFDGRIVGLEAIKDGYALSRFLEQSCGEKVSYQENGEDFYQMTLLEAREPVIATYTEMSAYLDRHLELLLQEQYPVQMRLFPARFAKKSGGFKEYKEVKEELAALYVEQITGHKGSFREVMELRFGDSFASIRDKALKGEDLTSYLYREGSDPLAPFTFERVAFEISRAQASTEEEKGLFDLPLQSYSDLLFSADRGLFFSKVETLEKGDEAKIAAAAYRKEIILRAVQDFHRNHITSVAQVEDEKLS